MKRPSFLSIVPHLVKVVALVLFLLAVAAAAGLGVYNVLRGDLVWSPIYSLAVIAGGAVLSTWLLGLGYIYADAHRRAMRPVLWVLVALFFPHLLGFLLYFVLRGPIAARCPHCGNTIPFGQRFCSWCGTAQPPPREPADLLAAHPGAGVGQS